MAREMKAETEASVRPLESNYDPGFYASFWIYPIAEALSSVYIPLTTPVQCTHIYTIQSFLGAYHMQLGFKHVDLHFRKRFPVKGAYKTDPQAVIEFSKSADYYQQAAEKFPEDDEERAYFLAIALEALWWSNAALRITLPICRKIRGAMSKSVRIWEFSKHARSKRNVNCEEAIRFLAEGERKLAAGKVTLDSVLMPPEMVSSLALLNPR